MSEESAASSILTPALIQKLFPYFFCLAIGGGAGTATGFIHPTNDQDRLVERVTILEVRLDTLIEGSERIEDLLREISAKDQ
tara:strand:+ start:247 stop:492 length:246 start_codon:yes stop_codon:yes gene_type:complete